MKSIWTNTDIPKSNQLTEDLTTDTVVIGGGLAGLLTAYKLKQRGIEAVVIEANTICSGQTQNTTAKITSQHSVIYSKISKHYGSFAAHQYAVSNQKAIEDFKNIIDDNGINCDFEKTNAIIYSMNDTSTLECEFLCAKKAGIPCYLTQNTKLPFEIKNALVFKNQAQFHPLKFINGIFDKLTVYEHTRAIRIVGDTVLTPKAKIKAKHIVMATHYPFVNFPAAYFLRMSQERSYVIAYEGCNFETNSMYIGTDKTDFSIRNYQGLTLIGGGSHRAGKNDMQKAFCDISDFAKKHFKNPLEVARWSAQDCISLDSIPYIGHFSKDAENIYIATGFNKWGMTSSMVGASIISDMICGIENPYADIFSPQRLNLSANAKNFGINLAETVKGFASHLKLPLATQKDVPIGSAREIWYKNKMAGAYRHTDGKLYIVSLVCPHLKCKLKWNQTTKTWDCPCHGSRYDFKGNLLDNPAQHHSILLN